MTTEPHTGLPELSTDLSVLGAVFDVTCPGFVVATSDPGVLGLDGRAEVSLDHLEVVLVGVCVNLVVTRRDVLVLEPGLLASCDE